MTSALQVKIKKGKRERQRDRERERERERSKKKKKSSKTEEARIHIMQVTWLPGIWRATPSQPARRCAMRLANVSACASASAMSPFGQQTCCATEEGRQGGTLVGFRQFPKNNELKIVTKYEKGRSRGNQLKEGEGAPPPPEKKVVFSSSKEDSIKKKDQLRGSRIIFCGAQPR